MKLYLLFALIAFAADHRPYQEMRGDCAQFSRANKAEFTAWEKTRLNLAAKLEPKELEALLLGQPAELSLLDQSSVKFPVKPGKEFKGAAKPSGGLALFTAETSGVYRLSLGSKLWVDLVEETSRSVVEPTAFEMQTKCSKIFKVVEFPLEAGKRYVVQLSSSKESSARILLTKAGK